MLTIQNALTWLVAMAFLTGLIPGIAAALVGRSQRWSPNRTRTTARGIAVALSLCWWALAVYGFHSQYPLDWIGATVGTPIRVLAFLAWCLSPGYLAPLVANNVLARVASPTTQPQP